MFHISNLSMYNYSSIKLDIYLICLIFFLGVLCYLISYDITKTILNALNLYNIYKINIKQIVTTKDLLTIAQSYIFRKKWLSCILILEFFINKQLYDNDIEKLYNYLASCFYSLKLYNKAEQYYMKIIEIYPSNIDALNKLADIYNKLKETNKATLIHKKISKIDKNNKTAQNYANNLSKKNISG